MEKGRRLLGKPEKLSLAGWKEAADGRSASRLFTPLLDIPLDLRTPPSSAAALPKRPPAGKVDLPPPQRTDIDTVRCVHFDEASLRWSERGRSPLRSAAHQQPAEEARGGLFTLQSAAGRSRPSVLQAFGAGSGQQQASDRTDGRRPASGNSGPRGSVLGYQLKTVSISKTKQSLGKFLFLRLFLHSPPGRRKRPLPGLFLPV